MVDRMVVGYWQVPAGIAPDDRASKAGVFQKKRSTGSLTLSGGVLVESSIGGSIPGAAG